MSRREDATPQAPIDAWHALLDGSAGERLAADTHAALEDQLTRRGLVFGDRALCTVLRPRFLSAAQLRGLARRTEGVMRAFRAAHEAALADPAVRAQFRLNDWEASLLAHDAGFAEPSPTSRVDAFVVDPHGDGGTMALTEYNAETPAGAGFNDALTEAFLELPAMRAFARGWRVLPMPTRHGVTAALLDAWRQFSGNGAAPRIAILDWDDVPTRREFTLFQEHFATLGLDCVIGDPARCEYAGGRLTLDGGPIDLVYKRVLLHELVERLGVDTPVLRAWKERAVCLVNPPASKVLHKKASLAVLTDERNAHLFDADTRAVVQACVPWTRVVEERQTVTAGGRVDLVPYVLQHRDRFVLKPNDDYGGAGIVLGWTVEQGAWEAAVARALEAPYVVQERVAIPTEPYPGWHDGGVQLLDRMIDTAPFVTHGAAVDGMLTRLSTAALLNVTAGGGSQVPSFVVEPR
ncbi:hypothetical protein [Roseisolibacter sp. H3M3-2]|uniref:hypothetical protein n=1 Tax=Roseisolibacter sp. H3M3-2 TaxID=3031323 RepID=UPI0023DA241B|nr:hypothetical protein [Roseisolibacter sp. H3M3-2]MDF1503478.1 hypothetical protein [Roseisolibacter sp. H3M3-2]